MKWTKLSLVAALAVSSAVAGGDIDPVEPVVAPVVEASATTISGKITGYYITDDYLEDAVPSSDMFGDQAQLAFGATLDVSHKFTDWLTANFSAVGYLNTMNHDSWGYFEGDKYGAFFNVANLTATFGDTTLVAGRQLMGTPMLQGYDWLLAPESFESYTVMNTSIENVTLVGSYVTEYRPINSGEFGVNLDDDNFALGAAYDDKTLSGSIWYYDIGHQDLDPDVMFDSYTQVYADLGYDFGSFKVAGQYVDTNFDTFEDSTAFGVMASTSVAGFDLSAAYNNISDNSVGFVGWNGLYTNQWNSTVANQYIDSDIDAFKVAASTTIMGVAAEVSYADYDSDLHEFDVILGYDITDAIDVGVVYTNTKSTVWTDVNENPVEVNQLEIYANYKF